MMTYPGLVPGTLLRNVLEAINDCAFPSPATAGPTLAPSQRLGPHAHVVRVDVLLEAEEVQY